MRKIKSIIIIATRYIDHNSCTYYSTRCFVNGVCVGGINYTAGYWEAYMNDSFKWLENKGLIPKRDDERTHPWQYCDINKIDFYHVAIDVTRKKDMFTNGDK